MGLAAYGKPIYFEKILNNLFKQSNKSINLELKFFNHFKSNFKYIADENLSIDKIYSPDLEKLFSEEIKDNNFQKDFASSTQKVYEFFLQK